METKNRKELQSLAKRKGIKANMTSKKIIECLKKQTPSCNKSRKNTKSNISRKHLQTLAKNKGIKANISNDKIVECLKKQTVDCNTRKQQKKMEENKSQHKTIPNKIKKGSEIRSISILHDMAFIPDDKYDYYNDGVKRIGKSSKSIAQIDAMSDEQYYDNIKQNYETSKSLRAEVWPKDLNAVNKVVPEIKSSALINKIVSLCKNQQGDNIHITLNKINVNNAGYEYDNIYKYSYKCEQTTDIIRILQILLNQLQKFPFQSAEDYQEYKEKSNPFREDLGVVNVLVHFSEN